MSMRSRHDYDGGGEPCRNDTRLSLLLRRVDETSLVWVGEGSRPRPPTLPISGRGRGGNQDCRTLAFAEAYSASSSLPDVWRSASWASWSADEAELAVVRM